MLLLGSFLYQLSFVPVRGQSFSFYVLRCYVALSKGPQLCNIAPTLHAVNEVRVCISSESDSEAWHRRRKCDRKNRHVLSASIL